MSSCGTRHTGDRRGPASPGYPFSSRGGPDLRWPPTSSRAEHGLPRFARYSGRAAVPATPALPARQTAISQIPANTGTAPTRRVGLELFSELLTWPRRLFLVEPRYGIEP